MEKLNYTLIPSPCLNCKDRKIIEQEGKIIRCHSWCNKYKEYEGKLKNRKEQISKAKEEELKYQEYMNKKGKRKRNKTSIW